MEDWSSEEISKDELHGVHEGQQAMNEGRIAYQCLDDLATDILGVEGAFQTRGPSPRSSERWLIGMAPSFYGDIPRDNNKLQARVFAAIMEICQAPTAAKGTTIQPLTGNHKGLWRYRVGDFRLIYEPDSNGKVITLHAFTSRDSVY